MRLEVQSVKSAPVDEISLARRKALSCARRFRLAADVDLAARRADAEHATAAAAGASGEGTELTEGELGDRATARHNRSEEVRAALSRPTRSSTVTRSA